MHAVTRGDLIDGMLPFNGFKSDLGLEVSTVVVSLLGHFPSYFGSDYTTLTAGPNFGEYYNMVVRANAYTKAVRHNCITLATG